MSWARCAIGSTVTNAARSSSRPRPRGRAPSGFGSNSTSPASPKLSYSVSARRGYRKPPEARPANRRVRDREHTEPAASGGFDFVELDIPRFVGAAPAAELAAGLLDA